MVYNFSMTFLTHSEMMHEQSPSQFQKKNYASSNYKDNSTNKNLVGLWSFGPRHTRTSLQLYVDNEGPDQHAHQGLHCLQTESFDTIECFNGEQVPSWDFAHLKDEVNLHLLCTFFLLDVPHFMLDGHIRCLDYYDKYIPGSSKIEEIRMKDSNGPRMTNGRKWVHSKANVSLALAHVRTNLVP